MAMKVREVIERLEAEGWTLVRIKGDHRHYRHPNSPTIVTVAGHPNENVPAGTLGSIHRKAGWK